MELRGILVAVFLGSGAYISPAAGKETDFRPDTPVECKTSYSKDEWAPCTFVAKSYDGSQPITRDAQGFEKALPDWNWLRPLSPASTPVAAADAQPENTIAPVARGQGLMSQDEIIAFLRGSLGSSPFSNPHRYEIKSQLVEEIKRRGIDFHFNPLSRFFDEMSRYTGMDTELTNPLHDNYGPPTQQTFFMGVWTLDVVGAPTLFEKDGDLYRKEASAAANIGSLSIDPDGSYLWSASAPAATFRGKWRAAKPAEMLSQGGAGIVLLSAKSGWDWIVTQVRGSTVFEGDVIYVSYIDGRGVREIGSRKK